MCTCIEGYSYLRSIRTLTEQRGRCVDSLLLYTTKLEKIRGGLLVTDPLPSSVKEADITIVFNCKHVLSKLSPDTRELDISVNRGYIVLKKGTFKYDADHVAVIGDRFFFTIGITTSP